MMAFSFLLTADSGVSAEEKKFFLDFVAAPSLAEAGKLARKLVEEKNQRMLILFWQQATLSFPQWAAAWVCYADSLLKHGMLDSAWIALMTAPVRLQDNPKALYILDKIVWILGYDSLYEKICAFRKRVVWSETDLLGLEMWETVEGSVLCDVFRGFLSEERMLGEFDQFCLDIF